MRARPLRVDGYAPIRDYAAIGDGRTVALVARDGAVDWLALPTIDAAPVLWSLLDAERGGRFTLAPEEPFESDRRYRDGTNVLETTFHTAGGTVRVTDLVTIQDGGLLPWFELVRKVEGLAGSVALAWELRPRFGWGSADGTIGRRGGAVVATDGTTNLALLAIDVDDEPVHTAGAVAGRLVVEAGRSSLLVLVSSQDHPVPLPPREEVEARIEGTERSWRQFLAGHTYDGAWKEAVERSVLALKLLIYAPTGAITAAATTSLPERVGGPKNWDYRFCWVRDSTLTLDALMRLGYREQAHSSFAWLLDAVWRSHPRLQPVYTLDKGRVPQASTLDLDGYRGSRPVQVGNGAADQLQLGGYGNFLETAWLYVREGNVLDDETGRRLAEVADQLTRIWRNDDAGMWELAEQRPYTSSKVMAWVCLDRALRLEETGQLEGGDPAAWRRTRDEIEAFVERECWSDRLGSYTLHAGADDALDAAALLAARMSYGDPTRPRMRSTTDAVRARLGAGGPLLYRYSGVEAEEGAFLACSFWLVEALARGGRRDEAAEAMEATLALANDVGLFSEQIDPSSRELLGNFPQGLTHLALIMAAAITNEEEDGDG